MTIAMLCPGCSNTLKAPESAAGKKVRCPKCQSLMLVPEAEAPAVEDDFEVVDDEPLIAKRSSRRIDDDEDSPARRSHPPRAIDDDEPPRRRRLDDDDRPQPRKKTKKKAESGGGVLAAVGGVLATIVVVVVIVLKVFVIGSKIDRMANGTSTTPGGFSKSAPASNWVTHAGNGWRGSFPEKAPTPSARINQILETDASQYATGTFQGKRLYFVLEQPIAGGVDPNNVPAAFAEMANAMRAEGGSEIGGYNNSGFEGRVYQKTVRGSTCIIYAVFTRTRLIMFGCSGESGLSTGDADLQKYVNDFSIQR